MTDKQEQGTSGDGFNLVEDLVGHAAYMEAGSPVMRMTTSALCREAADEIRRLRRAQSDVATVQDLLMSLGREEIAHIISRSNAPADPMAHADQIITYIIEKARSLLTTS